MDLSGLEKPMEQQLKMMELLPDLRISSPVDSSPANDNVGSSISEFVCDPDSNVKFDTWFRRYENLFKEDFANRDDAWRIGRTVVETVKSSLPTVCLLFLSTDYNIMSFQVQNTLESRN
ncbi:unnamed protein product [Heterobilharzia americana]|nr:unnamed protein product [Heterobilharzia americana]CAH8501696.1 unnamed protein product [Heterobilharzia americana]